MNSFLGQEQVILLSKLHQWFENQVVSFHRKVHIKASLLIRLQDDVFSYLNGAADMGSHLSELGNPSYMDLDRQCLVVSVIASKASLSSLGAVQLLCLLNDRL